MFRMTGAQYVTEFLRRCGIRVVSGIPGASNLPLYDALAVDGSVRHVLARHEQGAGFIAQGQARTTGLPAVFLTTSGPGATNAITALADARADSVPVVCLTGQVSRHLLGRDSFQEVDTCALAKPATKRTFFVGTPDELVRALPDAFRTARSGRPGPVLVDIPRDLQTATVEFEEWPDAAAADPVPAPDGRAVERAAASIDAAERPVFLLGGGVQPPGASALALALAERQEIPAAMTLMGLGSVPAGHRLSLGWTGMHAPRWANMALAECDLLVAVGTRFADRSTGRASAFCPGAKVVHVNLDPRELGKIRAADVAVHGDAAEVLSAWLRLLKPRRRPDWLGRIAELRARHPLDKGAPDDLRSPHALIAAVAEAVGPEAVVTTDVGQHQMWAAQSYPVRRPRSFLTSGGIGTMGFGLPAAIGAALARPGRPVVCLSGDGSLLMNVAELATAAEEGLDVKVVVFNNRSLGLVRQQQTLFHGRRIFGADFGIDVDFAALARSFGFGAVDLAGATDPEAALRRALRTPGPRLVNAPIDKGSMVLPMVPPGGANTDTLEAPAVHLA